MTKKVVTNDGKKGGWLVGKRHYDKNGKSLGGIKAVVTDAGGKPVELEGGEVIINREASKKYWKELSQINQSAGNGVAIAPPSDAFDEDPSEDYENGGKIEFNANHIPNKWILNYAIKIKEEHPDVWALGGNIFGNQAFINLKRVAERGHWLDSEEWMYKKWRSFVARHQGDFRIQGVIAMLKWVDKVDKGWQYMKNLIEEEIKKREARKSKKMNDGGNVNSKVKYSVNFKKRKSLGNYDRELEISESNKTLNQIYNLLYNVEYKDNGWQIKGGIIIKDDNGLQIRISEFKSNLDLEKMFAEKRSESNMMNDGGDVGAKKIAQMQTITYTDKDFIQEFNLYDSLIAKNSEMSDKAKNEKDLILSRLPFTTWHLELKKGQNIFEFLGNTYELFSKSTKLVATTYRQRNFHETRWGIKTLQTTNENTHLNKYGVITNENSNPGSETKEKLISTINYNFQKLILRKQLDVIMPDDKMRNGGNVSKTPAPASERIKGSKFNASGSAKDSKSGEEIKFDDKTIASIQSLIDAHNEKYPLKKITLGVAKAVVRRGMGAYSSSHRPTITGGKPNSRTAWGLARLKAFIHKAEKGKSKSGKYSQDNDLFDDLDIKVSKFDNGGDVRGMNWYSGFKKQQLKKGTEHELEHADTIEKFKKKGISDREVAAQIAKDHLEEDENYYIELDKMEGKKFATGGLITTYGGTANIGDKGQLSTRKGRVNIEITNITDKWVIFNDLDEGGKRKDTPRDKFIENYKGNAPLGSSVQSQSTTSSPQQSTQQTTQPSQASTSEWRAKTEDEFMSDVGLDGNGAYLSIGIDDLRLLFGKTLTELGASKLFQDELDAGVPRFTESLEGWRLRPNFFTNKPLPTSQSNVVHELANYRIKTEQEFINEYGKNWQKQVGWLTTADYMDWLFGEKITDIVTSDRYDEVLNNVKNGSRFGSDFSTKKISDVNWSISPYMYMFDPVLYSQNAITNVSQAKPKEFGDFILKKNVTKDDFKDIKINVYTRDKSEAFQKLMFSLGIDWKDGQKSLKNTDKIYLLTDNNFSKEQTLGFASNNNKGQDYYENSSNKEIKFDDLFELKSQAKPVLSDESLKELFKDVKEIDKEREALEATPQKNETQINDELKSLEDEYNDLLFLIDLTPSTDVDNMLSLKLQAKQLKDRIDLLHLDLKKKIDGELQLLDNLFNASSVQPQERYQFNAYNDGFAPDGEPTSLPKNLYDWTMTQEFQNWFGNFTNAYNYRNSSYENVPCSVVVNKHYEPLVVYHGTGAEFSFFKFDKFPAMYFAENEAYSNWFAEMKGQQSGTRGYVYPFFLNIRTPLDLTNYGIEPVSPDDFIDWMYLQTGLDAEELKISKALLDPSQKFQAWMYLRNSPEMLNVLRDKAVCDGIVYYEDNPSVDKTSDAYKTKAYIVFNSNSAKIADPNREMMTIPAMRSFYLKRGGKL